jgi:hypothetical protein
VLIGKKIGYIDKTGHYVINPQFLDRLDFRDGLAELPAGDKSICLNSLAVPKRGLQGTNKLL